MLGMILNWLVYKTHCMEGVEPDLPVKAAKIGLRFPFTYTNSTIQPSSNQVLLRICHKQWTVHICICAPVLLASHSTRTRLWCAAPMPAEFRAALPLCCLPQLTSQNSCFSWYHIWAAPEGSFPTHPTSSYPEDLTLIQHLGRSGPGGPSAQGQTPSWLPWK